MISLSMSVPKSALASLTIFLALGCVPLRLTTHAYQEQRVNPSPNRSLSLELAPNQGASLQPPPQTFAVILALEADSLDAIHPILLRTEFRGISDTSVRVVVSAPAIARLRTSGRSMSMSMMHLAVPLTYQEYRVTTVLEWDRNGRRDTLTTEWRQRPSPTRRWFVWPWQMFTDG